MRRCGRSEDGVTFLSFQKNVRLVRRSLTVLVQDADAEHSQDVRRLEPLHGVHLRVKNRLYLPACEQSVFLFFLMDAVLIRAHHRLQCWNNFVFNDPFERFLFLASDDRTTRTRLNRLRIFSDPRRVKNIHTVTLIC